MLLCDQNGIKARSLLSSSLECLAWPEKTLITLERDACNGDSPVCYPAEQEHGTKSESMWAGDTGFTPTSAICPSSAILGGSDSATVYQPSKVDSAIESVDKLGQARHTVLPVRGTLVTQARLHFSTR